MWQRIFEVFKKALLLAEEVERNKQDAERLRAEIKELRQENRSLNEKLERLMLEFHRLNERFEQMRQNEQHEREKLALQLKVALLEYERRLPPAKDDPSQ
ncbi:MAG: hypothetical protein ACREBD_34605 [Blastocatellia bacterium]